MCNRLLVTDYCFIVIEAIRPGKCPVEPYLGFMRTRGNFATERPEIKIRFA